MVSILALTIIADAFETTALLIESLSIYALYEYLPRSASSGNLPQHHKADGLRWVREV